MSGPITSATVVLDGSGNGTIGPIGPGAYGVKWHVDRMVTSTTSTPTSTYKTKLDVYRNAVAPGNLIDHTNSGNADVSETSLDLRSPDTLTFKYTGGQPGAIATIVLNGDITRG